MKIRLDQAKRVWTDDILVSLWSYRTTSWSLVKEMLYMMTFSTEVVILVEVELLSSRTQSFDETQNLQYLRANLALIEEVKTGTKIRSAIYKQNIILYYNRKVKKRQFQASDLVLRKEEVTSHIPKKLDLNWEGPFKVIRRIKSYAYQLKGKMRKNSPTYGILII